MVHLGANSWRGRGSRQACAAMELSAAPSRRLFSVGSHTIRYRSLLEGKLERNMRTGGASEVSGGGGLGGVGRPVFGRSGCGSAIGPRIAMCKSSGWAQHRTAMPATKDRKSVV